MKTHGNGIKTEQGFSLLSMTMMLTVVSTSLLGGFHFIINRWQETMIAERRYYTSFNQASSSLNWSATLSWENITFFWQCKQDSINQLKVCVKKSLLLYPNYVLVRGEYDQFYLYHFAHQQKNSLFFEKGHWLDYCPEKKSTHCD